METDTPLNLKFIVEQSHGQYIPARFAKLCLEWMATEGLDVDLGSFDPNELTTTLASPDNEFYWEAWSELLDNFTMKEDGKQYILYEDQDLFLEEVQA